MILVVDEYETGARSLVRLLSSHGYTAAYVTSGAAALDIVRREPVSLVITDYTMPEMDGLQLLEALKSNPATAHIAVIFLSAAAFPSVEARAMSSGAAAWLTKGRIDWNAILELMSN